MKTNITFGINSTNCNGSMHLSVRDDHGIVYSNDNFPAGASEISFTINWPTTLHIQVSNKNKNDVQFDSQGNIVNDKAIEVQTIKINNFPLQIDLIDQVFDCQRNGSTDITHENYWGFNGNITMQLTEDNPMRYMLNRRSQFDLDRLGINTHE